MTVPARWLGVVALLTFGGVLGVGARRYRAVDPLPASAPAGEFSAERARAVLARILGDGSPHPLGTAANAAVRARIADELQALGLEVEHHEQLVAHPRGSVARVHNLLARIEGDRDLPAILIAAHHDSVGAGPGASDDGVAVAAMIETARALVRGPRLPHPILLLIDDGEEFGLFGARAFCEHHPAAKRIAAVLNFEARGTSGPSLMFETAGDDAWLLAVAQRVLQRPMTGSAFTAVYRTLPNSTDMAVFRRHGLPGLNFAFIGDAGDYHTPNDDLAHVNLASMQHHGEQMLALARALAAEPRPAHQPGSALFFDVLALGIVALPSNFELPIAGGLVLLHVLATAVLLARRRCSRRQLVRALALAPVATLAAAAAGWGLGVALQASGALPGPWPQSGIVPGVAYFLAGVAAMMATLRTLGSGLSGLALLLGTGTCAALVATAVAASLPGASAPILLPATATGLLLQIAMFRRAEDAGWISLPVALTAGVALAPLFVFLPMAIGLHHGAVHAAFAAAALGWLTAPLAGATARWVGRAALVAGLASLAAVAMAILLPTTPTSARPRNIVYTQVATKAPVWALGDLEPAPAGTRLWVRRRPLPWLDEETCVPAEDLGLDPPVAELRSREVIGGRQVLRIAAHSPRGAPWLSLWLPPGCELLEASIDGIKIKGLEPRARSPASWRPLTCFGLDDGDEVEFVLTCSRTGRDPFWVVDRTPGLPATGRPLARARDHAGQVPIHLGDGVVLAAPLAVR